jgi:hypothetical protein
MVDEYDIFVSKLSSKQENHQSDLGVLALKLDKDTARHRLFHDGRRFLDDPKLKLQIEENWRFIFQELLFPELGEERSGTDQQADQQPQGTASNGVRPKRSRSRRRANE